MADAMRKDQSDAYLMFFAVAVLVAATGAILLATTDHDVLGTALLLGGDAAIITVFVVYLWRLS